MQAGYATSHKLPGRIYAADMVDPTPINLTSAVNNMITAYNDAAGRTTLISSSWVLVILVV